MIGIQIGRSLIRAPLFLLLCFFSTTLFGTPDLTNALTGNVKGSTRLREYGKVPPEEARNVYRSGGITKANKSLQFYASYLLWAIYNEGMNIAVSNRVDTGSPDLPAGNTIRPYSPVRSGLKVAGGKILYYDDWEALVGYSWINNENKMSTRSFHIDNIYYTPWTKSDHIDIAEVASKYSNQFNRIWGVVFKPLAISKTCTFTPWIGALGAWEDSYLDADIEIQETITDFSLFTMRNKQYWWCVGPYSGIELKYTFWKPLSIFMNSGGSINLCKHSVTFLNQEAPIDDLDNITVTENLSEFYWTTEPMIEAAIGLEVEIKWNKFLTFLKGSWEAQTWFDHNGYVIEGYSTGVNGNYSMQGLTMSIGVIF